jgi:hypothetical protein
MTHAVFHCDVFRFTIPAPPMLAPRNACSEYRRRLLCAYRVVDFPAVAAAATRAQWACSRGACQRVLAPRRKYSQVQKPPRGPYL